MSVSDSNRVQMAFIAEDTFGVQKTGSNLQLLRHTGETLKQDTSIIVSNEIRSDRQTADVARTNVGASGNINFELHYGSYDVLLMAALMAAAWSSPVTVASDDTDVSCDETDGVYTFIHASGWDTTPTVGEWIKVTGFTTAGNNGYCKVTAATSTVITITGLTLVDEAAGDTINIVQGASITSGTTKHSYNVERTYADLSNELSLFTGMMVNELSLNAAVEAMATGSFGFIGQLEDSITTSGGSGYDAASTTRVMNCVDHILGMLENQAAVSATNFSLTLNNNLRGRNKLGTLGNFDVGVGAVNVSGSLTAYFESATLFDKYLDFTQTSLAMTMEDTAGNGYIIDLPAVNFTDGDRGATGQNQDIIANLSFQAFRHPTEGETIRIVRFPAA